MGYQDTTYVIFDGDENKWAYSYMKGWKQNENVDFDFKDAHDIGSLTDRAENETYIKSELRKRFSQAKQVIVIIGEKTKNLYKYVRWELEVAQDLGLPIIAVNLNNMRGQDDNLCPPIIKDKYVVHIPFKMKIIKYALDNFPSEYKNRDSENGPRSYPDNVYDNLELN
ncbi:MAG TPA: TIR domain-containing protein [Ignavibacteria bacterium]|nr:TIR domain-containing protein [Ignavibacteria bacterium]HMR41820.1 TIR domain-containing protein [Ignavibacteria bacterium]